MKRDKKQNKKATKNQPGIPLAAVYPDSAVPQGHAPIADDYHVSQAKDWVDHNKK